MPWSMNFELSISKRRGIRSNHGAPQSPADSAYLDQFSRDGAFPSARSQLAAKDDVLFLRHDEPFSFGGFIDDRGLIGGKLTPETLTTACQAAS
ncbi:protein of unknown function (plasmid) [Pararobbsia alpina]